ncbi:NAD(P)/FAD-dependent oxidoreductase [Leucobacter sp. NPDC015123]|uniref:NAD(P)/FAD-dependent oxidoreductase n=1 Tax=Leucobacter sp. NPDC015123 TaxID=3364129 RepID=UPI0036F44FF8
MGKLGTMGGRESHWSEQAGHTVPRPEMPGSLTADVAIVGAGHFGLWTAYYLKKAQPRLRIVVLEERHVGHGTSGSAVGRMTGEVPGGREPYARRHGRDALNHYQRIMNDAVANVLDVAATERIDADIVSGGELIAAYTALQDRRLRAATALAQKYPHTNVRLLDAAEVKERMNLAGVRSAILHPHAARFQPAKFAHELARVVERMGVAIYERTRVEEALPFALQTSHGVVEAEVVVGGSDHLSGDRGWRRLQRPVAASLIATEPLTLDMWDDIGWGGNELLASFASPRTYAQRTADGRIVVGGQRTPCQTSAAAHTSGKLGGGAFSALRAMLHRVFPSTRDAEIAHTWAGNARVVHAGAAKIGFDRRTGVAWAGAARAGVATANLSARTITDLVLDRTSELTELPTVRSGGPRPAYARTR